MKPMKCEDCVYYDELKTEQPCCGCVDFVNFECDHPTEKCGSCEWAMPVKGTINGVYVSYIECQNPEKVWNHNSSRRKKRTTPKCRFWQPKKKGGEE